MKFEEEIKLITEFNGQNMDYLTLSKVPVDKLTKLLRSEGFCFDPTDSVIIYNSRGGESEIPLKLWSEIKSKVGVMGLQLIGYDKILKNSHEFKLHLKEDVDYDEKTDYPQDVIAGRATLTTIHPKDYEAALKVMSGINELVSSVYRKS
ncbi:MAG: hypothetical protein Q7S56_03260 [Nanoarchaeota archaeon]|nr:hypothetical protein [Nanoarchaeota archaeon]